MKTEELMQFLITPDSTVVEALQKIDNNFKGILFVADADRKLMGVLTDGDIRRWLLKTGTLKGNVQQLMNQDPKVIYRKDIASAKASMENYQIAAIPVVNTKGIISDIIFKQEDEQHKEEQKGSLKSVPVVIMAGGKGTRLYPYTKILPKPLIPIGDIPIMERIICKFRDYGVDTFYATVNYRKTMIESYFSDKTTEYKLIYVEEEEPLGTAGSLALIQEKFEQPVFVTNCDILICEDYSNIYQYHKDSGNELTIVSASKNIVVPYGVIYSTENGLVQSMEEKPRISCFINTGMYILNPELIREIPKDTFFHMTDLAEQLMREKRKVGMYPISEDSFLDMGEFAEMRRMEERLGIYEFDKNRAN
jgi:dTDP-glucose pyrophosphorylase